MPAEPAESFLFAPLSYYKIRATVVPMPRGLDDRAQFIGRRFFSQASVKHERFLALGDPGSYPTLDWLESLTSTTYVHRVLCKLDRAEVIEFAPRSSPSREE
jgi:hypothetical protein